MFWKRDTYTKYEIDQMMCKIHDHMRSLKEANSKTLKSYVKTLLDKKGNYYISGDVANLKVYGLLRTCIDMHGVQGTKLVLRNEEAYCDIFLDYDIANGCLLQTVEELEKDRVYFKTYKEAKEEADRLNEVALTAKGRKK